MTRRDALKTGLKGSIYAAPIVLGATVVQSVGAISPTPTATPTSTPVTGTPSLTVTPSSGPAGTSFTIRLANFPASTTGQVTINGTSNGFTLPVTTDANGNATVVLKDLSTPPGSYQVSASVGNSFNQNPPTIQITAPALVGAVTVTSAGGCDPTVFTGSGFPTGVDLNVNITSPSGTRITGFNTFQAQPDGTFQLFSRSLSTGSLKVVVQAGQNVLNTTPFLQAACAGGTQPFIAHNGPPVVAGEPLSFSGIQFVPGSTLTVSARSANGTLLGSTPVTADGSGQFSGTLSTTGFPVGAITLVVTPTGSNTVLAINDASIV
ncbi:MAG: hypothetical protein M3Y56_13360 [Armatimonadota bacterium]|nr:hypothetical protein [Armatimonadota bacterium]